MKHELHSMESFVKKKKIANKCLKDEFHSRESNIKTKNGF